MDDLLKRLLQVEKQAETILADAQEQARKIMADARKQANDADAKEQEASAADYDRILSEALDDVNRQRQTRLQEAETSFQQKCRDYTEQIQQNRGKVTAAILGEN